MKMIFSQKINNSHLSGKQHLITVCRLCPLIQKFIEVKDLKKQTPFLVTLVNVPLIDTYYGVAFICLCRVP